MILVSSVEIADRLGVKRMTVHQWRQRNVGFPDPLAQLAIGPVWDWADVEAWAKASRRLPSTRNRSA